MTAPTYRYYTADILTGDLLGELPLYGVYCDRSLKQPGNFTGTYKLGTGIHNDLELIDASYPMRTAIYVERNDELIWGGILWSRTFGTDAKTVQLSAQTFESYFSKVLMRANFARTNVNQLQTLIDLIDDMQSEPRRDLNIITSGVDTTGGNLRTINVLATDQKWYADAISELADAENGFDWFIAVTPGAVVDHPDKLLVVGQPVIESDPNTVEVYDYPGNIVQFYWPESGSKSGTDFFVNGSGSGDVAITATSQWAGASGYPEVDMVFSRKDINNADSLQGIADALADQFAPSISNPTITIKPDADPIFQGWNSLGAYYRFELEAPRWTERKVVTKRVLGWELSPASSEQTDTLKLMIEGEDEGA